MNNNEMLIVDSLTPLDFTLYNGGTTMQHSEREIALNGDDDNTNETSLLRSSAGQQDTSKPYRIIFKGVLVHD